VSAKRLIHGTPQSERERALLMRVEEVYDEGTRDVSALFIVPTAERAAALRRAVTAHFGGRCWAPRVETTDSLLAHHAADLAMPFRRLDTEARALLVRELAGDAGLLGRGRVTRGLARKVVGFLDAIAGSWYDGGPDVDELARSVSPPSLGHVESLASFARTYDAALARRGLMDRRRLASALLAEWRERGYPARARMLVLDEIAFALPVDLRLFDVMSAAFEQVVVTLPAPEGGIDAIAGDRGFAAAAPMARWSSADAVVEDVATRAPSLPQRVGRVVFAPDPTMAADAGDVDSAGVRVVAFAGRREEARGVARMIRLDLGDVQPDAADFGRYGVVMSSYGHYATLVEETFREYGLPANMARGALLSATPLLRVAHKILTAVADDEAVWTIREIMDVLRHAQFDRTDDALEEAAILSGAPSGVEIDVRPFWVSRFERLIQRVGIRDAFNADDWYARATRYLGAASPEHDPEDESAHFEEELQAPHIEVARDLCVVRRFVDRVTALRGAASARDFADRLLALLDDYGLGGPAAPSRHGAIGADDEYEAWEAFGVLLRQTVATFGALAAAGRGLGARDLAEALSQALGSPESRRPPGRLENAVAVMSPEESVGLSHDRLYMVGLVEGEFPGAAPANFLIDAAARRHDDATGPLDNAPIERFLFREAMMNAEAVVLTYPRMDDGRVMSPSPFLDDVCAILGLGDDDLSADPTADAGPMCVREALALCGQFSDTSDVDRLALPHGNVAALVEQAASRESVTRWGEHDTYLPTDRPAIAERLSAFTGGELSATHFDTYARCPARLFYGRVLSIGRPDTVEADVAPNVRGILIHAILERFFSSGGAGLDARDWAGPNARARMRECAERAFEEYDAQYPNLYWAEEKRALVQGLDDPDSPQGLLAAFLVAEDEEAGVGFEGEYSRGRYNEVAFGAPGGKRAAVELAAHAIPRLDADGHISLKGRVDRVDVDEATGRFVVFDYKSGFTPPAREALGGMSFQLAIYMDALAEQHEGVSRPAGGVFYSLRDPMDVRRQAPLARSDLATYSGRKPQGLLDEDAFAKFREVTRDRVREIESHMRHGRFPVTSLTPDKAGCGTCDYRDICRVRASRRRRMETDQPHYSPEPFTADDLGEESA
jgi:RecB family exonuclease